MAGLLNLSSEIFEQELWFFSFSEDFLLLVDVVSVVDTAQSESFYTVDADVSVGVG
jgi:hypothetical protein